MMSVADRAAAAIADADSCDESGLRDRNNMLARLAATDRVAWALEHLPANPVLSSSFGAQSAVSLHMLNTLRPGIPVIFVDTGYHFPETYSFVDELTARLDLNLKVFRGLHSPAWQEARHGERWLQGVDALKAYNYDNKVEPMNRALRELQVGTWFAGLRREQSESRRQAPLLVRSEGYWKVHPLADWSDRDIGDYLQAHELPYHPLWHRGYVSIGDMHTTKSLHDVDHVDQTRFFGLKRECGLHARELDEKEPQ